VKYTRDMWFSSYLLMNGIPLNSFTKENGRLTLYFDLTEDQWADWRLRFAGSDIATCKMQQDKLKDLLY